MRKAAVSINRDFVGRALVAALAANAGLPKHERADGVEVGMTVAQACIAAEKVALAEETGSSLVSEMSGASDSHELRLVPRIEAVTLGFGKPRSASGRRGTGSAARKRRRAGR